MNIGKHSSKWINSAARRRCHAKFRRHLCRILGCPVDSCYSTGELHRDARKEREQARARGFGLGAGCVWITMGPA